MKQEYVQPKWAIGWDKLWTRFCNSCRALADVLFDIIKSLSYGSGFMASKVWLLGSWVAERIFALMGNALNPVIAANIFIIAASCVVFWGLYSWVWVGITLGSFLGVPTGIAGILGFIVGVLLNIAQVLPEAGQLCKEYANVLGRAEKEAEARQWDEYGVNAQNFLSYSWSRLKMVRNLSFVAELSSSALYQFVVGGFTKTVVIKGVSVAKALPFWPMMGSIAWCGALVVAPEWAIRAAAAAVHFTAELPKRNYA